MSRHGTVRHNNNNPKFGTTCIDFDGTPSHLQTSASDDLNFGSSDFTVDFWFRFELPTGIHSVIAANVPGTIPYGGTAGNLWIEVDSSSMGGQRVPRVHVWYDGGGDHVTNISNPQVTEGQ